MRRKLVGVAKVYMSVKDGVATFETVWPRMLYDAVHGTSMVISGDRRKACFVSTWATQPRVPMLRQTEGKP